MVNSICIVSPDLAGPTRNGGIGTHCLYLARFLVREGQRVTLVHTGVLDDTDRTSWRETFAREHKVELLFLDELPGKPPVPVLPHTARHLTAHHVYRWLRTQDFSTVFFQDWQGNGAICLRAKQTGAAFARTRLIVVTHGSSEWIRAGMHEFPAEGRETLIDDALERTAVALADTIVSPSQHLVAWMREHGWSLPADTRVIPYLFEPPANAAPPRALAPGELTDIVFFGRLETRKGLEPFLDALELWTAAPGNGAPVRVHFIGKPHTTLRGPARAAIEQTARAVGARMDVRVHDSWNHGEALAWLAEHPRALVVTPSLADNAPFTVIECLALGQPLLGARRGGIPELVASPAHLVEPVARELARRLVEIAHDGLLPPVPAWSAPAAEAGWRELVNTTHPAGSRAADNVARLTISVCVPHFNDPAALAFTLERLARQTQPPHDVIVCDDGSADEHLPAWSALEKKYQRAGWTFLRASHAGPAATRNAAAAQARGEAVVFCDADNRPAPDMLERLGRALVVSGSDVVTCAFAAYQVGNDSNWPAEPVYHFSPLGAVPELALLENFIGDTNFIIRRNVFAALRGFDPANRAASEDWELLLGAMLAGHTIAVLPDVVFDYRLAPQSHARRHSPQESATAAWSVLPADEIRRYGRLLQTARGTFSALAELGATPTQYAALVATRQHAANLEKLVLATEEQLASTRTHARNLEAAAEAHVRELGLLQQHAGNLERLRADAQAALAEMRDGIERANDHVRGLEQTRTQLTAELSTERNERAQLARELITERSERAQLGRDLVAEREGLDLARQEIRAQEKVRQHVEMQLGETREEIARLRRTVEERDHKIQHLHQSLSWRLTAPLRALRRTFIDPYFSRGSSAPGAAKTARPQAPFLVAVDVPTVWDAAPSLGSFTGWCVSTLGEPARAMRAIVGASEFTGRYGLRRADVALAHKFTSSDAAQCGFQIPYRLPVDTDHQVVLEAQTADGTWRRVFERTLHTSSFPRSVRDYSAWVETFGGSTPERAGALRGRLARLPTTRRPLLSVVLPTYNPPERFLVRAIESVRAQIYEQWELCIADDCSTAPDVRRVLEEYAAKDPRIRVTFRPENGHISRASNSALELAHGDYIVLLDHDDELSWDALAEVAIMLGSDPDVDVVYSDEDKIDEDGRRYDPYFKPDFLPDLLTGQNCLSHLSVFRATLVRDVGGFRVGYEGSQDWDLALRIFDVSAPNRIRHLSKVLYHWRAISGSTAIEVTEKSYSLDAARRALLDHFARRQLAVDVRPVPGSHWQIVYPLPDPAPLVSIVIPSRNAAKLLRTCVESIDAHTRYSPYEFVIVNNRTDEADALALLRTLAARPDVRVVDFDAPFNFSGIVNHGVSEARGEVVCLLNNDIEAIDDRWLTEMTSHAVRPEIGAVGAMLYYPDRTIQHAGIVLGLGGVGNHAFGHQPQGTDGYKNRGRLAQNYSAVTAACLVIRRSVFQDVGGFNEKDLAVAFNDVDFCIRVRNAGYRNLWTPFAELIHHESVSRGREDTPEKQARFDREVAYMRATWGDQLDHDPAYNLNLALSMEGWDLAWPPRQ